METDNSTHGVDRGTNNLNASLLYNNSVTRPSEFQPKRHRQSELLTREFYNKENWFDDLFEILFKIKERETTIQLELYCGFIHFISCLYVLAVAPQQLSKAGYNVETSVVAMGLCCGIGSIVGGLFANLPFVIAPTSVVSIFLAVYMQSNDMTPDEGSAAVILSGILIMTLFIRPVGKFIGRLIPLPIQVGTTLGVGLLTALAGAAEISLVQTGSYALLEMGPINDKVIIAITGITVISVGMYYHVKGSFVMALIGCTLIWWIIANDFPNQIAEIPDTRKMDINAFRCSKVPSLTFELFFLYVLYLSGLIPTFSDLAKLKRTDGSTPRGRWLFIISGFMTILSGGLTSAPILISPESSAAIKAGAKTGLSSLFCGILFAVTVFFSPIFQAVPSAGTAPLLIMIGIILFQDVNRLNWKNIEDAAPAFMVMFFIPFTYSIINGVVIGYIVYIMIGCATGTLYYRFKELVEIYIPSTAKFFGDNLNNDDNYNDHNDSHHIHQHDKSIKDDSIHDPSTLIPADIEADLALSYQSAEGLTSSITGTSNRRKSDGTGNISNRSKKSTGFTYDRNAVRSIEHVNISLTFPVEL